MRVSIVVLCTALTSGCAQMEAAMPWLNTGAQVASQMGYGDQAQVSNAIKQALDLGSQRATASLSVAGGYSQMGYRIGLPDAAKPVVDTLRKVGMGSYVDKAEAAMSAAAEQAAGESLPVFQEAIKSMSVNDALGIVSGPDTAATDYFRGQTEHSLRARYAPIVQDNLKKTGFYHQYQTMLAVYDKLPFTDKPNLNAEQYVIDLSLAALYDRMGKEEALIRQDPVGRGTALIGVVFAGGNTGAQ